MKRILLLAGILFLFTTCGYAETNTKRIVVETMLMATDSTIIPIAGETTIYTKSFSVAQAERMAVVFKTISVQSPKAAIILQQSTQRPATEGSADSDYVSTNTSIPQLNGAGGTYVYTIDTLTALPFARFMIIGLNGTYTRIQLKVGKQ